MSQPSNLMESAHTVTFRVVGGSGGTWPYSHFTCPKCGQRIGNMQVHFCNVVPRSPWIDPNPFPPVMPPPSSGYWCSICGAFVPDNMPHKCLPPTPKPQPLSPGTKQPFTCPKCHGEKKVNGKRCVPCGGTGIVWG